MLELPALGEHWRLHQVGGEGAARVRERGGLLRLSGVGSAAVWRGCLIRWMCARARTAFEPMLAELATRHGFELKRLSIRLQRTRWGSCSTRGTISINLALLFQRPEVLRYLMCHELAHTRHMNHSAAYWRTVAACEPAWQSLDRELSQGWSRVPQWFSHSRGEA
jgi:predicted metal-dependent hydrolase